MTTDNITPQPALTLATEAAPALTIWLWAEWRLCRLLKKVGYENYQ